MILSSPGDIIILPLPHSTTVAERTGSLRDGHNPTTSCLACLREKYRDDSLSIEASEGRTKSPRIYNSCSENGLAGVLKETAIPFQDL